MRGRPLLVGLAAAAAIAGTVALVGRDPPPRPAGNLSAAARTPGGHPIDAAQIATGRLAVGRMPPEVTGALELHSAEIVKTAQALEAKQARVTGTCPPGAAIRVIEADGSVACQKFPRGTVSVSSLTAVPRSSATQTAQGAVPGGVGRYQTAGEDDFLVAPVSLPDGAVVTGFSYVYWDADPRVDGIAYLYRSDDTVLAGVPTADAREEVRVGSTEHIEQRRVDNSAFAYFVYFQVSAEAGSRFIPIAAIVSYRLP
jgi:hypothetical protein